VRIALISDVHANLPALEAVLDDVRRQPRIDAVFHLGDLVGYAPWPNETVAALADAGITGIAGNYDSTVGLDYVHCGCKYENADQERLSHESFEWTKAHTTTETKQALAALPFRIDFRPFGGHLGGATLTMVHGTPALNTAYWTEDRSPDFCARMAAVAGAKEGDVIAFGHTHLPYHRVVEGIHFVNAGSVGRPKDGDWRAAYALLDMRNGRVEVTFRRVAYDLARTQRAIVESGLPAAFAAFLESGGGAAR
jgi:predicted phosphodiesterase